MLRFLLMDLILCIGSQSDDAQCSELGRNGCWVCLNRLGVNSAFRRLNRMVHSPLAIELDHDFLN